MHTFTPEHPPQPEGAVWVSYNPMQPAFWDLAPHNIHTYIYRDIQTAVGAARYWVDQIVSQRPPEVSEALHNLPGTIFYRGQSDFSHRLIPTRLRGPHRAMPQRLRVPLTVSNRTTTASGRPQVIQVPGRLYAAPADIIDEVRRVQGSWAEHEPAIRDVDAVVASVTPEALREFERREDKAIGAAMSRYSAIATLDPFRRRAAVRHYTSIPSALLDVTSDIEVAAFFATGAGHPPPSGAFGVLWAIDLGMLLQFFHLSSAPVPGGYEVLLEDTREDWGDNAEAFENQNIPFLSARLKLVELPLPRPTSQKGFFLELRERSGAPLSARNEAIWWSLLERWSYPNGFIQTGRTYENPEAGVSTTALLPSDDPFIGLGK